MNIGYPSRSLDISRIAEQYLYPAVRRFRDAGSRPVHFVGHSLGCIVIRQHLHDHQPPSGTRVVMLAPPNSGSELADLLMRSLCFRWIMGPAAMQLGTGPDSVPNMLGPPNAPVGVIAGTRSCLPCSRRIFQGPNDGKVSVTRTILAGMSDFLIIPCGHTFMPAYHAVREQVVRFLRTGTFVHDP